MSAYVQVPLAEVCTIVGGGTPRRSNANYFGGEIPWATPTDVTSLDSLFVEQTKESITDAGLRDSSARLVPAETVLMTSRATIGYTAIATRPMSTNQGFANLICSECLAPEYLAYWLRHQRERLIQLAGGTTFRELPKSTLKKVRIPLPLLDEQRRIVGILNRVAKIERLRARAQERLREFIPALFVRMFGDPVENPMGWEVAALGDVCAIVGGGTPRRNNPAYFGGAIPWATPTDVTSLKSLTIEVTKETLTEAGLQESSARLVPAGTVLLTSRATIGFTAIAAVDVATNQGFANLTCRTDLVPEYLACWLRFRRAELIRLAGGTTFKEVSKSTIKKMYAPLPPLDRQRRFAEIASKVQTAVARADIGTQTASALSVSLMSRLLESGA